MNPIITRPAGGWTEETVPTTPGRPFSAWDGDALVHEECGAFYDAVTLAGWLNADDTRAWQYSDCVASDADVRAAIEAES